MKRYLPIFHRKYSGKHDLKGNTLKLVLFAFHPKLKYGKKSIVIKYLNLLGNKVFKLTFLKEAWVRKDLSVVRLRLKLDLEGKPTIELDDFKSKKSIATTRSFEKEYTELKDIQKNKGMSM